MIARVHNPLLTPAGLSVSGQETTPQKVSAMNVIEDIEDDVCLPGRIEHGSPNSLGLCPYCDAQLDYDSDEDDEEEQE